MADEIITDNDAIRYPTSSVRVREVFNRISWGAVWAGVVIALGMELLLTLFGLFIGFGMYKYQEPHPWAGVTPWTTAWYLFTSAFSMFFGAWCASRLSGNPTREAGILHGLTTWGLATVATVALVTMGTWSVLREGLNVETAATITTEAMAHSPAAMARSPHAAPAVPNTAHQANREAAEIDQHPGPMAQAAANRISGLSLRIWGGVMLGFVAAIFGGSLGRPRTVFTPGQQVPLGPTRLAA